MFYDKDPHDYDLLSATTRGRITISGWGVGRRIPVAFESLHVAILEELSHRCGLSLTKLAAKYFEYGFQSFFDRYAEEEPEQAKELVDAIEGRYMKMMGLDQPEDLGLQDLDLPNLDPDNLPEEVKEKLARAAAKIFAAQQANNLQTIKD